MTKCHRAVRLGNGAIANLRLETGFDGFYNEVFAPEEDGSGQAIANVTVCVDGQTVASASAGYLNDRRGGHLAMLNIIVDEKWRRQGIATAIYDHVEAHYGNLILPYPGNEGGAIQDFWIDRLKDAPDLLQQYSENIGSTAARCSVPKP